MKQAKKSRHRRRVLLIQGAFLLALGAVVIRMQVLQHVFGPLLLTKAQVNQDGAKTLLAQRGKILDAQGQALAYDVPAFMMDVKVKSFPDKQALAQMLASALKIPVSQAQPLVASNKYTWVRWPRSVSEIQKEAINKALNKMRAEAVQKAQQTHQPVSSVPRFTQFVTFSPTEKRVYPFGDFASNVLGYVDHKGGGQSGLEMQYNKILSGSNGKMTFVRDGDGFPIQSTVKTTVQPKPGEDIHTTIDSTIQSYVETSMNNIVSKYHPKHAAIIVENPDTGAILGMSSRPNFNPNQYWNSSSEALNTNWAVNSTFEPGSTFKVLTLAAALATHTINLNQTFMSGHMYVDGKRINDWKRSGWGKITFRQALEYSSNVGFATIALKLGWSNLLHYMKNFGYLSKTGIGLPNEATSIVFSKQNQHKIELATSGFGQGIAVTPLQQIAGVAAIANGGKLMKPYIVQQVTTDSGKVVKKVRPTVVNAHVVPQNIAATVSHVMALDVSKGIDSVAAIKGYSVAGKTGTAQIEKPTGGYYANRYIVSFIGYAPAKNPKVEVYVTVYNPHTKPGETWGSTVAAPAARNIMKECLAYYHVPPSSGAHTNAASATKPKSAVQYVQTPNLTRLSKTQASTKLKQEGLTAEWLNSGTTVSKQWPEAGIEVAKGTKMYLYSAQNTGSTKITVPNLTGASLREAGNIATVLGLKVSVTGQGYVTSQSIQPGTQVKQGAALHIVLSSPKLN
ncbi:penicillin-binding transpeptidase domain-containing protein [Alicyclobacillus sp. SO9]|uniref:penicillin-binding transpeptidase domain-containing protein n=1 Tax=Alicyclobacillus sp. SO9 TaxID=2665646 RepID=UPI0018E899DE|nr:penicillin-binding transpeptidase domain-containing protein [Alicyclobacillus sp. SO9]QQE80700.1 PASTA domain-containing protein [Alicyclobacillus sp. SO9]